ncbi:hypothetical protein QT970_03010 [Microcoleus sp. herbarium8]|uniref:hypothetical protein n=1 Tax=Microcoleus sp. herbarium8 TaxID=3055436 RepID=UPI002FD40863
MLLLDALAIGAARDSFAAAALRVFCEHLRASKASESVVGDSGRGIVILLFTEPLRRTGTGDRTIARSSQKVLLASRQLVGHNYYLTKIT